MFFCDEEGGNDGVHEVSALQVDQCVWKSAELTGNSFTLARLSAGDMVALEAKYHTKCLLALYNNTRKVQVAQQQVSNKENEVSGVVFAELVMYTEEVCLEQAFHQFLNSPTLHSSVHLKYSNLG